MHVPQHIDNFILLASGVAIVTGTNNYISLTFHVKFKAFLLKIRNTQNTMILSRSKPALSVSGPSKSKIQVDGKSSQQFEDYLARRDYSGAITLLEVFIQ